MAGRCEQGKTRARAVIHPHLAPTGVGSLPHLSAERAVADVLALAGSAKDGRAAIRFHSDLARAVQHVRQTAQDALAQSTLAELLERMKSK